MKHLSFGSLGDRTVGNGLSGKFILLSIHSSIRLSAPFVRFLQVSHEFDLMEMVPWQGTKELP
jgi:hypothetical protein